jgi:hemerythrin-like domain-containing protein
MSIRQLLHTGLSFAEQLTAHHLTEEYRVFPVLAKKMPEFDPAKGDLLGQHALIHDGLELFKGYLTHCVRGDVDFEMNMLRKLMESFGETLWTHLDQEVEALGAENMSKYWSEDEMRVTLRTIIGGHMN